MHRDPRAYTQRRAQHATAAAMQHPHHHDEYDEQHAAASSSPSSSDPLAILHAPARVIQRAYRRFTSRRIFAYFRDLIVARQSSNPYLLLKLLSPAEFASLHGGGGGGDHASGLYLRFRLGGAVFPPVLYYKTFSAMPVTDIGSFAPRDYARDRKHAQHRENVHLNEKGQEDGVSVTEGGGGLHGSQLGPSDRAYWYRRFENNGWRPILHDSVLAARDETLERTAAKTVPFHPNKLVRALDAQRRRKGRKIEWLKKLYSSGIVALPTQEELDAKRQAKAQPHADDGEQFDSDEEEWNAWKAAAASPSAAAAAASSSSPGPSPAQLLSNLMSLDSSSPALLLPPGAPGAAPPDWESEADQLLEWCSGLGDFEGYANDWATKATTRPNAKEYRAATTNGAATPAAATASASSTAARPASSMQDASAPRSYSAGRDSASSTAQGVALDAQLSSAIAAAAAAAAEEDAENASFPSWIQQTASRAQLDSARASQSNLQSHTGSSTSRSQLSASPSQRSDTAATAAATATTTQHVHVKAAISAGQAQPAPPKQQTIKRGGSGANTGALAATLNASSLTRLRG